MRTTVPIAPYDAERVELLRAELEHLDVECRVPELQILAECLQRLFGASSTAAVSYLDAESAYFLGLAGPDAAMYSGACRRDCLICSWTFLPVTPEALVVHDTSADRRFKGLQLAVTGKVKSYVGSPIVTHGGLVAGTVCVVDDRPRAFSSATAAFLAECAQHVADVLADRPREHGFVLRARGGGVLYADVLSRQQGLRAVRGHPASLCEPTAVRVPMVAGEDAQPRLPDIEVVRTAWAAPEDAQTEPCPFTVLGRILGKGAYGTVRQCIWNGCDMAVKVTDCPGSVVSQEALWGCALVHPHLVRHHSVFVRAAKEWLVLELCDGSAQQVIDAGGLEPDSPAFYDRVRDAALQIARGVRELHKRNYVHCDLKPGNVLLSGSSWKVGDLGLMHAAGSRDAEPGTVTHMPPECVDAAGQEIGFFTDVYSFGVVLWELLTSERAWAGHNPFRILFKLTSGQAVWPLSDAVPEYLGTLVRRCTAAADARPDMAWCVDALTRRSCHR